MQSVVMWAWSTYKWLWLPLAARIKKEHGAQIHFLCNTEQDIRYFKSRDTDGIVNSFTALSPLMAGYDAADLDEASVIRQARAYEEEYRTLVVDALQVDRHLGRGFAAGGVGHPRSELSERSSYMKSLNHFNTMTAFWEEYFDCTHPDLIVGIAAAVIGKTCSSVARKRGIPLRMPTPAKYRDYYYWTPDEYYSFPQVREVYAGLGDVPPDEYMQKMRRLPWTEETYRLFRRHASTANFLGIAWRNVLRHLYRRLKHVKDVGNYKLGEMLAHNWRSYRAMRAIDRLPTVPVEALKGKNFVLFPLHMEPESSVSMLSPEFNEQLAAIEFLAKNLPAGVLLAVKEHIGSVGRRPREFYQTLLDIPNVVMLPVSSYALDAARMAKAVAVITSTLGSESAAVGIPVISFAVHNIFDFLPHVYTVRGWLELRPLLAKLCGEDTREARERRERDGWRYLEALKRCSFNLAGHDYRSPERAPANTEEVDLFYGSLIKSLRPSAETTEAGDARVAQAALT